jgi:hypothetical protein
MAAPIYNRQYLRDLPELLRRQRREQQLNQQLNSLFNQIQSPLMAAAGRGETKYLYDMMHWMQHNGLPLMKKSAEPYQQIQAQAPPEDRSDELLAGLREKFPDCSISFQEDWIETRQGVKELKKGILIDWS